MLYQCWFTVRGWVLVTDWTLTFTTGFSNKVGFLIDGERATMRICRTKIKLLLKGDIMVPTWKIEPDPGNVIYNAQMTHMNKLNGGVSALGFKFNSLHLYFIIRGGKKSNSGTLVAFFGILNCFDSPNLTSWSFSLEQKESNRGPLMTFLCQRMY